MILNYCFKDKALQLFRLGKLFAIVVTMPFSLDPVYSAFLESFQEQYEIPGLFSSEWIPKRPMAKPLKRAPFKSGIKFHRLYRNGFKNRKYCLKIASFESSSIIRLNYRKRGIKGAALCLFERLILKQKIPNLAVGNLLWAYFYTGLFKFFQALCEFQGFFYLKTAIFFQPSLPLIVLKKFIKDYEFFKQRRNCAKRVRKEKQRNSNHCKHQCIKNSQTDAAREALEEIFSEKPKKWSINHLQDPKEFTQKQVKCVWGAEGTQEGQIRSQTLEDKTIPTIKLSKSQKRKARLRKLHQYLRGSEQTCSLPVDTTPHEILNVERETKCTLEFERRVLEENERDQVSLERIEWLLREMENAKRRVKALRRKVLEGSIALSKMQVSSSPTSSNFEKKDFFDSECPRLTLITRASPYIGSLDDAYQQKTIRAINGRIGDTDYNALQGKRQTNSLFTLKNAKLLQSLKHKWMNLVRTKSVLQSSPSAEGDISDI